MLLIFNIYYIKFFIIIKYTNIIIIIENKLSLNFSVIQLHFIFIIWFIQIFIMNLFTISPKIPEKNFFNLCNQILIVKNLFNQFNQFAIDLKNFQLV